LLLCGLLALAACNGPSNTLPIHTAAVTFDPASGKYQLSKVELSTITDLESLKGSVADIQGGAEIVIDSNDPILAAATTNDEIKSAILKDPGGDVRASFITSGDTQFPADFQSENMVTTYFNFERSFDFYSTLGWSLAQGGTPTVYYFPTFIETQVSTQPLADNAAFFSLIGGFMILPFQQFQDVPLPMNLGIIGHEYSHFQTNTRVYSGQAVPDFYNTYGGFAAGTPSPAANVMKAFDEGFADLFGTGVTCFSDEKTLDPTHCDPDFIAASIPEASTDRRLDTVHCYDQTLYAQVTNDDLTTFTNGSYQYQLGTVLASSIWKAAHDPDVVGKLGQQVALQMAFQSVYDALDDESTNGFGIKQFLTQLAGAAIYVRPESVADAVIFQAQKQDDGLAAAMCNAFIDRLGTVESLGQTGLNQCQTACTGPTDLKEVFTDPNSSVTLGCLCACTKYPTIHSNGECAAQ